MQGEIAQAVALVLYGNYVFQTGEAYNSFPANSTCASCNSVTFVASHGTENASAEDPFAHTPQEWFQKLRDDGVHGLRLRSTFEKSSAIDQKTAAVIGGGYRWLIEAVHGSSSDYWQSHWQNTGQQEPDNRI